LLSRIVGVLSILAGLALLGLGVRGILEAPTLALDHLAEELRRGSSLDICAWRNRWIWWCSVAATAGAAIGIAGAAIVYRKRWGFLVLACAAALGAFGPWILELLGLVKYPYEQANVVETFVLLALSLLAVRGFFSGARRFGA
jgi:hypothetical protein